MYYIKARHFRESLSRDFCTLYLIKMSRPYFFWICNLEMGMRRGGAEEREQAL